MFVAARPKIGSNIVVMAEVELAHFFNYLYSISQYTVPRVVFFILGAMNTSTFPFLTYGSLRLHYA